MSVGPAGSATGGPATSSFSRSQLGSALLGHAEGVERCAGCLGCCFGKKTPLISVGRLFSTGPAALDVIEARASRAAAMRPFSEGGECTPWVSTAPVARSVVS